MIQNWIFFFKSTMRLNEEVIFAVEANRGLFDFVWAIYYTYFRSTYVSTVVIYNFEPSPEAWGPFSLAYVTILLILLVLFINDHLCAYILGVVRPVIDDET